MRDTIFKPFYGMNKVFKRLVAVLNVLVLSLIYMLGFGLCALCQYLMCSFLRRGSSPGSGSYWRPRASLDLSEQGMEDQF